MATRYDGCSRPSSPTSTVGSFASWGFQYLLTRPLGRRKATVSTPAIALDLNADSSERHFSTTRWLALRQASTVRSE